MLDHEFNEKVMVDKLNGFDYISSIDTFKIESFEYDQIGA